MHVLSHLSNRVNIRVVREVHVAQSVHDFFAARQRKRFAEVLHNDDVIAKFLVRLQILLLFR